MAAIALAGAGLVLGGFSPGPLVVAAFLVLTAAAGQRTTWTMAVATSGLSLLTAVAVAGHLYPAVGLSLAVGNLVLLLALVAVGLGVLLTRRRVRLPNRDGWYLGSAAVIAPGLFLGAVGVIQTRADGTKLAWAMNNDSAWYLMTGRFLIEDRGVDNALHESVAPLTSEWMALFMAPGRSEIAPGSLLQHDILRVIDGFTLILAFLSVVGALVVARKVAPGKRVAQAVVAVCAGCVPWTWFVAGSSFALGFWNSLLSCLLLALVWLAWVEAPRSPRVASALQACGGVVALAVWPPLVLIPAGFGLAIVLRHWRAHAGMRGRALVLWLLPLLGFAVYAVAFTLPTFLSHSSGLALNGAFVQITWSIPVVIVLLTWAVALVSGALLHRRWDLAGLAIVTAAGVVGTLYLADQRSDAGLEAWGYYPAKFAWLLCLLMPFIAGRAVAALMSGSRITSRWESMACVLAVAAVMLVILVQIPPGDSRPYSAMGNPAPRPAPDWRPSSVLPVWSLARKHGNSDFDPAAELLMNVSDPSEKVIVSRYFRDPTFDSFVNFWLLQQPVDEADEMPRPYAYTLDATNAAQVCEVVSAWGGGVTVVTRDRRLSAEMLEACPEASFRVDVRSRREGATDARA